MKLDSEKLKAVAVSLYEILNPPEISQKQFDAFDEGQIKEFVIEAGQALEPRDKITQTTADVLVALKLELPEGITIIEEETPAEEQEEKPTKEEKKVATKAAVKKEAPAKAAAKKEEPKKEVPAKKEPKEKKARYTRFHAAADALKKGTTTDKFAADTNEQYKKHGGSDNENESVATCRFAFAVVEQLGIVEVDAKGKIKLTI